MKTRSFLFCSLMAIYASPAFNQNDTNVVIVKIPQIKSDKDSNSQQSPVQFTFFYPLGTNGIHSPQVENNFSFNTLYGVNGGVEGIEIGGLVNANHGDVKGVQIGGIANITTGSSTGTVIGGIANVTADSSKGILIAGISNVIGDTSSGLQIAGISNTVNGSFNGGQIAGIGNTNNGSSTGFQLAGICNMNNGDFQGMQLSGIANVVHGSTTGAQIGFINYTKKMNGIQIGFINVARESDEAIPIGFLSFVKDGYRALEFSTTESIYGNVTGKLGVEKFYNTFNFGIGAYKNNSFLSYGYGIGSRISFTDKDKLALELSANRIISDFTWNWGVDLLNRLEMTYHRSFGKHFEAFAGPALNVYVTQTTIDGKYGSIPVPYTLYTEDWSNGNVSMWIGFHAGLALKF